ncbi:hypothetical protein [Psychrosphaera aestuarii]|uniref:hypothetical protein n=1 Tax=Psychrosphaera aestuarii TaxID=1266052 RepID=UPI001B337DA7|nr:hypothetical protein [Psychrosphaera aestuarii]
MIAVLTGDVVHSSKMSSRQYSQTIETLKKLILAEYKKSNARGDIYRGDEFQLHYSQPKCALTSALRFKLNIPCTLSLAFGPYDSFNELPSASSGPAYIASGHGLDNANRGDLLLQFVNNTNTSEITKNSPSLSPEGFKLLNQFFNQTLNNLTTSQANLLLAYIDNDFPEHKHLAELMGTSRQNISNRLSSMGAHLVRDYVNYINELLD